MSDKVHYPVVHCMVDGPLTPVEEVLFLKAKLHPEMGGESPLGRLPRIYVGSFNEFAKRIVSRGDEVCRAVYFVESGRLFASTLERGDDGTPFISTGEVAQLEPKDMSMLIAALRASLGEFSKTCGGIEAYVFEAPPSLRRFVAQLSDHGGKTS